MAELHLVVYGHPGSETLVPADDAPKLESDMLLYGNCYLRAVGSIHGMTVAERIPPEEIGDQEHFTVPRRNP